MPTKDFYIERRPPATPPFTPTSTPLIIGCQEMNIVINCCHIEFILFTFSVISQHWKGADSWNYYWKKTRIQLSCMGNTMTSDV